MVGIESNNLDKQSNNLENQESLKDKLSFLKLDSFSEQNFNQFLKSLENYDDLDSIVDIFIENSEDISDYIGEEGYPINSALDDLLFEFGFEKSITEVEEEKVEVKEEKVEVKEEKVEVEEEKVEEEKVEVVEEEEKVEDTEKEVEKRNLLKKEETLKNNKFKENCTEYIDENKDKLSSFDLGSEFLTIVNESVLLKNVDKIVKYKEEIVQPFLEKKGETFIKQLIKEQGKEGAESTIIFIEENFGIDYSYLLGNDKTKVLQEVVNENGETFNAVSELDTNHIPPKYILRALDSDYKFETKLNDEKIDNALDEYLEVEGLANQGLKDLNGFSSIFSKVSTSFKNTLKEKYKEKDSDISSAQFLKELAFDEEFQNKISNTILSNKYKLVGKLNSIYDNIDNIPPDLKITESELFAIQESPENFAIDMQNIFNKIGKLESYISNISAGALTKYKDVLAEIVQDDLKGKEQKVETLNFLQSIGFDKLPQSATDTIIERINNGSEKSTFGFTNKIDLANGNLGINKDGDINSFGQKEKTFFTEFMNILLSGDKTKPIDVSTIVHGKPIFLDDFGKPIIEPKTYISNVMGLDPLTTMQNNLENFKNKKQ